jgi:hypothetical protein
VTEAQDWGGNYFNYFTEIEDHFQKTRGSGLFLLSPLDWALIETWKDAQVPLEAVLRGIDAAFEKWRARKSKTQMVNSLAFCAQAVLAEAEKLAGTSPRRAGRISSSAVPFSLEALQKYIQGNAEAVRRAGFHEVADTLDHLAADAESYYADLEPLEQHLAVLEENLVASARMSRTEEQLLATRRELDQQLRPYRGKMTAEQLAMLEKQYFERRLLESAGLPRLSLFYLR